MHQAREVMVDLVEEQSQPVDPMILGTIQFRVVPMEILTSMLSLLDLVGVQVSLPRVELVAVPSRLQLAVPLP